MSIPQRFLLLAVVYLFIKRYVGDGTAQKTGPKSTAPEENIRDVPLAPLVKEAAVPDPVVRPRHAHAAFENPDDEFAGLGGSAVEVEKAMPLPVVDPFLVDTASLATRSSKAGAGSRADAGIVPQVLVQFCVS